METMQFRGYVFPHNPQSIAVSGAEHLAVHFYPGVGEVAQDLGRRARVVRCSGSFFGASAQLALAQLKKFQSACGDGGSGMLYLPGMEPFMARLQEFAFEAQGDGRIIPYTMIFLESQVSP